MLALLIVAFQLTLYAKIIRIDYLEVAQFICNDAHGKRCENGKYGINTINDGRLGYSDAQRFHVDRHVGK